MNNVTVNILRITIGVFFMLVSVANAHARVYGEFVWDYGHYEAEEGGSKAVDASHFAQKYSLFYETRGSIFAGRGGEYSLALGGEWANVESDIDLGSTNTDTSIETSKILYRGDVSFAPAGLPFKIHLYSRDMHLSSFEEDSLFFSEGNFDQIGISEPRASILTPHIIDDLSDGARVESGASLVLGIKNGSYLGRYRNMLSRLPKLYIDYRELYVRDLDTLSPEHYKEREMAFVSLNKKHNWIHFRFFDRKDQLTPAYDYSEQIILIGTVNHLMKREWINLTNWIKLSTDFSYTEENNQAVKSQDDENSYLLNFFAKTDRESWQSSVFSNYERTEAVGGLEREFILPIFASGFLDRDTSWRGRFIVYQEKINRPFALVNQESSKENYYASTRINFFNNQPNNVSAQIEAETNSKDFYGEANAFRVGMDISSSASFNPKYDFIGGLDFAYFTGDSSTILLSDSNFWEVDGSFNVAKNINIRVRTGIESRLTYGRGEIRDGLTDYIDPVSFFDQTTNLSTTNDILEDSFRSSLLWFGEHVGLNRLGNRVEVRFDYSVIDNVDSYQTSIVHRLDYSNHVKKYNLLSEVVYGENIQETFFGANTSSNTSLLSGASFDGLIFSSQGFFSYAPNKNWRHGGDVLFEYADPDDTSSAGGGMHILFSQELSFVQFVENSYRQKLYDIEEYLDYEIYDLDSGQNIKIGAFNLLGSVYPTTWSRLAAKIRVQHDFKLNSNESGYGLYVDLNFSKLDVGLEYELGMRTDDDLGLVMDRDEQRWKMSIKKTF